MHVADRVMTFASPEQMRAVYDCEPFGFEHTIAGAGLFDLPELRSLATRYDSDDYFVAESAQSPHTPFYDVPHGRLTPVQALDDLKRGAYRIILKRPERYDARFAVLLRSLFEQVCRARAWPIDDIVVRLDGAVLINSGAAITPLHFDPEVSFFFQIAGTKTYHLFEKAALSEGDLERAYVRDKRDIGKIARGLAAEAREFVFDLGPGCGIHQPQNTPHWVQTGPGVAISYVFSIETEAGRALGRTRAFNFVQRSVGLKPANPGRRPRNDLRKAAVMRLVYAVRPLVEPAVRKLVRRA